jgi:hypothetical protein
MANELPGANRTSRYVAQTPQQADELSKIVNRRFKTSQLS